MKYLQQTMFWKCLFRWKCSKFAQAKSSPKCHHFLGLLHLFFNPESSKAAQLAKNHPIWSPWNWVELGPDQSDLSAYSRNVLNLYKSSVNKLQILLDSFFLNFLRKYSLLCFENTNFLKKLCYKSCKKSVLSFFVKMYPCLFLFYCLWHAFSAHWSDYTAVIYNCKRF